MSAPNVEFKRLLWTPLETLFYLAPVIAPPGGIQPRRCLSLLSRSFHLHL